MKDKEYIKELESKLKAKDIELSRLKIREKILLELSENKVSLKHVKKD